MELDWNNVAEVVVRACRRAARFYHTVDPSGGDVLGTVYEDVFRAVRSNPEARGNETYIRVSAERQAHRAFRRFLRERLPTLDTEANQ